MPDVNALILRSWNEIDIPQRPDGYFNATKMCQAGGKKWSDFIKRKTVKEYISELSSVLLISSTDLIVTIQGGSPREQGTWIHPRLASRLA